jgi:antitoxin component of MazEF toxin-antitoxin module
MVSKVQKLQKIGNSSGVLLPRDWLREKGLKPGSRVRVEITDTRVIILAEEDAREIKVDARFARDVDRFIREHRKVLERLS